MLIIDSSNKIPPLLDYVIAQKSTLQNGKYRIDEFLNQGGLGITYLGVQTSLNRKVAIKKFFMKEYCN